METLNKISLLGLSAVLMFSLAITVDAVTVDKTKVLSTVIVDKKVTYPTLNKEQLSRVLDIIYEVKHIFIKK